MILRVDDHDSHQMLGWHILIAMLSGANGPDHDCQDGLFISYDSQERMDQIMEEARLCQEKLEELKMAAVQVAFIIIMIITILTIKLIKRNAIRQPHISISQAKQVFLYCRHSKYS